jgi:hypothetical protein
MKQKKSSVFAAPLNCCWFAVCDLALPRAHSARGAVRAAARARRRRACGCIYMSRGLIVYIPHHVSTVCKGCARIARMRCALDGRAEEVRVSVLCSAALGGARVRAPPACSRLRACDHSRLHGADARRTAEGCALEQAAGAACAVGAGLGQQWPGVALFRRPASAVN